ncbi:hypothetical protein AncyloWKF20_13640 [Ancylobacter sp. WKF20]|uniref:hypothetical protein n=1 Tax=Ancylobacter sp. WKF20 TaxID=3039801 RepID=UPI0024340FCC|nr:hypothetical protein [Ancylobacter sp. WKF20]WGD28832.1 hypothetical protein AncyloWKF20_13640 [Ancylobacter sp. WKF20]
MVALGAAYLLVLQLLLTGLALGTHAAPSLADGTHGVICLGAGAGASTPDAPPAPPHLPDCCQLGCLMGTALAPSPRVTVATAFPSDAASSSFMTPTSVVRGDQGWRTPHNSRAPPVRA